MAKKRLLCVLIFLVPTLCFCLEAEKKPFYKDKGHGWYNYEDPEPEIKKEKTEEFKKPVINWDAVQTMPPKLLNSLITDVMDYAITFPTNENVKDFLRLQDVAINRSRAYMDTFMYVVQTNPELSKENELPTSRFGADEKHRQKQEQINRVLAESADDYALLYFYSPECGYCAKQEPVLEYFSRETGWIVKPVNVLLDQKAALRFNIEQTPSIVMINKNSPDWLLIASGIIPLPDLKERIARGITGQETYRQQSK
jgi:conjugal transfer pilus assembly protein TraF